ncbi:MAG: pyridoxamine 5'-phosphate oxidase family protein [Desulfatiglandales bacterium]
MRRKEKEITDRNEIEDIILKAQVCRLGMADGTLPYIIPLCFGYRDNTLYFHTAQEGKKMDILRKNSAVCFECDTDRELIRSEAACKWGMKFRSVVGFGKASLIEDPAAKHRALAIIMEHYAGPSSFDYEEKILGKTCVIKVDIESMTGKKSGDL